MTASRQCICSLLCHLLHQWRSGLSAMPKFRAIWACDFPFDCTRCTASSLNSFVQVHIAFRMALSLSGEGCSLKSTASISPGQDQFRPAPVKRMELDGRYAPIQLHSFYWGSLVAKRVDEDNEKALFFSPSKASDKENLFQFSSFESNTASCSPNVCSFASYFCRRGRAIHTQTMARTIMNEAEA